MNQSPISNPFDDDEGHTRGVRVFLFSIALLLCIVFSWLGVRQYQVDPVSIYNRYFPSPTVTLASKQTPIPSITPTPSRTPTPTLTPTPHVLVTPPNDELVFEDAFDSNAQSWDAYYGSGNVVSVQDGRLHLASDDEGYVALAVCPDCAFESDNFYVQAEVVPAQKTELRHGLAVCLSTNLNEYYTFTVDSTWQLFSLFKSTGNDWELLIEPTASSLINEYPLSNTLAVRFDQGTLDLYINGALISSFEDSDPFNCTEYGIFVDGGTTEIMADNLFAYEVKSQLTATPTP